MPNHTGADDLVFQALAVGSRGITNRPSAGVGDSRFGNRVRQQELRWPPAEAIDRDQAFEQGGHVVRIEAGVEHRILTDAIRLGLIAATEAQAIFQRQALGRSDSGLAMLAVRGRHDNHTGQQGG